MQFIQRSQPDSLTALYQHVCMIFMIENVEFIAPRLSADYEQMCDLRETKCHVEKLHERRKRDQLEKVQYLNSDEIFFFNT